MSSKTLQMIADELGLNRSTVSLVINGKGPSRRISPDTVGRVQAYLRKVGYVPNRGAVALRTGRRSPAGILFCGRLHSHLTEAFNRMIAALNRSGIGVEVVVCPDGQLLEGLRELVGRGVRRAIWISTGGDLPVGPDRADALTMGRRLRLIVYNFHFEATEASETELLENGFSLIGVSRRSGYRKMARFLSETGHRRVLLPDLATDASLYPVDGDFVGAMEDRGLRVVRLERRGPAVDDLVRRGHLLGDRIEKLYRAEPFDGVALRDDEVAGAVIDRLLKAGLKIPEDFSVCSMDGHPMAGLLRVPLTTLALPVEAMVRRTLELVEKEAVREPEKHRFQFQLQRRASHRAEGLDLRKTQMKS